VAAVLDTTFGNGGTVEFLKSPNFQQAFSDIAVQSDGKVVAVASERFAGGKPSFTPFGTTPTARSTVRF
jgi:hypothetical protein